MNTPDNTPVAFTPVNDLERTLLEAVTDPSARPEFYKILLDHDILMLAMVDPEAVKNGQAGEDTPIQVLTWMRGEEPVVPLFSAVERLQEAIKDSGAEFPYVVMPGRMVFTALSQGNLRAVLNPRCALGKEFVVDEMRDLVSGAIFQRLEQEVVQEPREIMLGQPNREPREMIDALRGVFARHGTIDAAYLALAQDQASGAPPTILIGLQPNGDFDDAVSDAAIALEGMPEGNHVEFIVMDGGDIDAYFLQQTKPFFRKGESYEPAAAPAAAPTQPASAQPASAQAASDDADDDATASAAERPAEPRSSEARPAGSGQGRQDEKKPWWKIWG